MATESFTWEKPGPGSWLHDAGHADGAPTPAFRQFNAPSLEQGMGWVMDWYGAPLAGIQVRFVNGHYYRRLVPLVGGSRDMKPPPDPVLWLTVRVHPAFRRRAKRMRDAFDQKVWRIVRDEWEQERQSWIDRNLALQEEDVTALSDAALIDHLRRVFDHVRAGHLRHFQLHGADLGPIGDLLAHTNAWDVDQADVMAALRGATPASSGPTAELARIASLVGDRDPFPSTIEELRAVGPQVAESVDAYLRHHGWHIVTAYDVDGRALVELPETLLASVRAAAGWRPPEHANDPVAALRAKVPAEHRDEFDEMFEEARAVYGLRDDNGPLTAEWPIGLLRRAMVEAGRRLVASGRLHDPEHAVEVDVDELIDLLDGKGPSADEIAERAELRRQQGAAEAPLWLGPPESDPPVHLFPSFTARGITAVLAVAKAMDTPTEREPLCGTGIGAEPYAGPARVADRPEDVLATIEPGDVLVAAFTTPAYNTVLAVAGGIVVEEGGPLSHAAVMARELGIPAVVGAMGAKAHITDGDTVEVDPVAGRVRVLT